MKTGINKNIAPRIDLIKNFRSFKPQNHDKSYKISHFACFNSSLIITKTAGCTDKV